jgi:hypothetical protein
MIHRKGQNGISLDDHFLIRLHRAEFEGGLFRGRPVTKIQVDLIAEEAGGDNIENALQGVEFDGALSIKVQTKGSQVPDMVEVLMGKEYRLQTSLGREGQAGGDRPCIYNQGLVDKDGD